MAAKARPHMITLIAAGAILIVIAVSATAASAGMTPSTGRSDPAPFGLHLVPVFATAAFAPPVWAMYRRIGRASALDQEARRRFFETLKRTPGLTIGEAGSALGVTYKTAAHHARVLSDCGLVELRRDGRLLRVYEAGGVSMIEKRVIEGAPGAIPRAVLKTFAKNPALSRREVALKIGANRTTVYWHVRQLESRGLIVREPNAWRVREDHLEALERIAARAALTEAEP